MKQYRIIVNGKEVIKNVPPHNEENFLAKYPDAQLITDESGNQESSVDQDAPTEPMTTASISETSQSQNNQQENTESTSEDGSSESKGLFSDKPYSSESKGPLGDIPWTGHVEMLKMDEDEAIKSLLDNNSYPGIRAEKRGFAFGNAMDVVLPNGETIYVNLKPKKQLLQSDKKFKEDYKKEIKKLEYIDEWYKKNKNHPAIKLGDMMGRVTKREDFESVNRTLNKLGYNIDGGFGKPLNLTNNKNEVIATGFGGDIQKYLWENVTPEDVDKFTNIVNKVERDHFIKLVEAEREEFGSEVDEEGNPLYEKIDIKKYENKRFEDGVALEHINLMLNDSNISEEGLSAIMNWMNEPMTEQYTRESRPDYYIPESQRTVTRDVKDWKRKRYETLNELELSEEDRVVLQGVIDNYDNNVVPYLNKQDKDLEIRTWRNSYAQRLYRDNPDYVAVSAAIDIKGADLERERQQRELEENILIEDFENCMEEQEVAVENIVEVYNDNNIGLEFFGENIEDQYAVADASQSKELRNFYEETQSELKGYEDEMITINNRIEELNSGKYTTQEQYDKANAEFVNLTEQYEIAKNNHDNIRNSYEEEAQEIMNQTQEYYQSLIDEYLNDNKTHYNNYKEGIKELQNSDKKFTNRYQENIDAADAINREFRLGTLLQEDFENGFERLLLGAPAAFGNKSALDRLESIQRGVDVGLETKLTYDQAGKYGEGWRFFLRESATQAPNMITAIGASAIGLPYVLTPAIYGFSAAGDQRLQVRSMTEDKYKAEVELEQLEKNKENIPQEIYNTKKLQLEKTIALGDLKWWQKEASVWCAGGIEFGITSLCGTVPNAGKIVDDFIGISRKSVGDVVLRNNMRAALDAGWEMGKRVTGEIIEEVGILATNEVAQNLITGRDMDWSMLDDTAVTAIITAGPTNTMSTVYSTITTQMATAPIKAEYKDIKNNLKSIEEEFKNLKDTKADNTYREQLQEEYRTELKKLNILQSGLEVDAMVMGVDGIEEITKHSINLNELYEKAGVESKDSDDTKKDKIGRHLELLEKRNPAEAKDFSSRLKRAKEGIENAQNKTTEKLELKNALGKGGLVEEIWGSKGLKIAERLIAKDPSFEKLSSREKLVVINEHIKDNFRKSIIAKGKKDPLLKEHVENKLYGGLFELSGRKNRKRKLEDEIYEQYGLALASQAAKAKQTYRGGEKALRSIQEQVGDLKNLKVTAFENPHNLTDYLLERFKDDLINENISTDEIQDLVMDFINGSTKGMIFNGEYIAIGEKDAVEAMLEGSPTQAPDMLLGTVWMHETGHALDQLAMKEGEIQEFAQNLQEYLTTNDNLIVVHEKAVNRLITLDTKARWDVSKGFNVETQSKETQDEYVKSVQDVLGNPNYEPELDAAREAGPSMGNFIRGTILGKIPVIGKDFKLNTPDDAMNFLVNYIDSFKKGELSSEYRRKIETKKKLGDTKVDPEIKRSTIGDITEGINDLTSNWTNETWKDMGAGVAMESIFFDPILRDGLTGLILSAQAKANPSFQIKSLDPNSKEKFVQDVLTHLYKHVKNFNPEDAGESGLFGWINAFLGKKALDVQKRPEWSPEKYLNLDEKTEEGVPRFQPIADTDAEMELLNNIGLTDEQVEKYSQLRQDLGLEEDMINTVRNAVIKTFGTKLPDPRTKRITTNKKGKVVIDPKNNTVSIVDIKSGKEVFNRKLTDHEFKDLLVKDGDIVKSGQVLTEGFRQALERSFETQLKKPIQDMMGVRSDYTLFLEKHFEAVYNALPIQTLVQMEKEVGGKKDNEKGYTDAKRIFVEEVEKNIPPERVDKLISENRLPKDTPRTSGPSLWKKLPYPGSEKVLAFFRGTNSLELLGYERTGSTLGTRKDKVAIELGIELAFDATSEVVQDPEVQEKRKAILEIQGSEQLENEAAIIGKQINRNPSYKFSKSDLSLPNRSILFSRSVNQNNLNKYLGRFGDVLTSLETSITNPNDWKQIKFHLLNYYEDMLSSKELTGVAKDWGKWINEYNSLDKAFGEAKVDIPLQEFIINKTNQALLDQGIKQMLGGKFNTNVKSIGDLFKDKKRINRARASIVGFGNHALTPIEEGGLGWSESKLIRMLATQFSGMYASSYVVGDGRFILDDKGILIEDPNWEDSKPGAWDGNKWKRDGDGNLKLNNKGKPTPRTNRGQVFTGIKDFINTMSNIKGLENMKGKTFNEIKKEYEVDLSTFAETSNAAIKDQDYNGRLKQAKEAREAVGGIMGFYMEGINRDTPSIEYEDLAMLTKMFGSNMRSPMKRAANLEYIAIGADKIPDKQRGSKLEYEHLVPTNVQIFELVKAFDNDGKVSDDFWDDYVVAVIPKTMDIVLRTEGLRDFRPLDYVKGDHPSRRYYNRRTFGNENLVPIRSIKDGTIIGEDFIKTGNLLVKGSLTQKDIQNIHKAANNRVKYMKSGDVNGASVFDFDETLIIDGKNFVIATHPDTGVETKISSADWPIKGPELMEQGYEMNFDDFVNVRGGVEGPLFQKLLNRIEKYGPSNNFILTARPQESATAIHGWLKSKGVDIPIKNITGLGNSTGEAKAMWMVDRFAEGYNDMYFVDDALPNVEAVQDIMQQLDIKGSAVQAKTKVRVGGFLVDITTQEGRDFVKQYNEIQTTSTTDPNLANKKFKFSKDGESAADMFMRKFDDWKKGEGKTFYEEMNKIPTVRSSEFKKMGGWIINTNTKEGKELVRELENIPTVSSTEPGRVTKVKFSKDMNIEFNEMLERTTGIEAEKRFFEAEARRRGAGKGRFDLFIPPSAEDFKGMLYRFLGKGKQGDADLQFFKESLLDPFARGIRAWNTYKQNMANEYATLKKTLSNVKLKDLVTGTSFNTDAAVRVYLWDKAGFDIPGIAQSTKTKLINHIKNNENLQAFADALSKITRRPEGYVEPDSSWPVGSIASDLNKVTGKVGRKEFLAEWIENKNIIFSPENLNKIEATYGVGLRDALENILYRMENGTNRVTGDDKVVNGFLDWINGSVGAVMFFNIRSAALQTISTVNFINWSDNNIFKASAAFANQPQFWKDFSFIFNSDMLKQRRAGLQIDVSASELTKAFDQGKSKPEAVLAWLLEKGFTPTQIADSFAISMGGATFYRNRIKKYIKDGMTKVEAEKQAWLDFQEIAEETQQSSRPDLISMQQAGVLGRIILAWQNTPMQMTRLTKKALSDIVNGRGDMKTNISKIMYYGLMQNLIFGALQSGLMFMMFGGDDDEEEKRKKEIRVANGALDTLLRGTGVYGAMVSTLKNVILKWDEERKKKYGRQDFGKVAIEAINLSPPIGSKIRKIMNAIKTYEFNKDVPKEIPYRIENPIFSVVGNLVEAATNFPLARMVNKANNVEEALTGNHELWQRVALLSGWNRWDIGVEDEELEEAKQTVKDRKKEEKKKEREEKKKIEKEKKKIEKQKAEEEEKERKEKEGIKTVQCSGTNSSGKRCGMTTETNKKSWKCYYHAEFKDGMDRDGDGLKEYQCTGTTSSGKRCKNKTENKNKKCYAHQ